MKQLLEQQVTLVTGAASGIGLATAKLFAKEGAIVALIDYDKERLINAQKELDHLSVSTLAIQCDVSDEESVKSAITQVIDTFGRLDIAFNNAGIQSPIAEVAEADGEEFDRVHAINLKGIWNCMKYELIQMKKQSSGAIVNTSSLGGLVGIAGRAAYHSSKHAVIGLTKSAALEYADIGIRINAICPGIIETPMVAGMLEQEQDAMQELMKDVPIKRLGQAEEIAQAVLWLSGPYSKFVIGHALVIDGGYTIR
ncbi:glucose 1-dehydrogenase [Acinetobacter baumannii]